jgi:hypothetical protein
MTTTATSADAELVALGRQFDAAVAKLEAAVAKRCGVGRAERSR